MGRSTRYRIGEASELVGASIDTLRYYEKLGLLPRLGRAPSGAREFDDEDITRLRFIRRAQAMNFKLAEIAVLLDLRDRPPRSKPVVREMAQAKIREIDERVAALTTLRDELNSLVGACPGAGSECPILTGIEGSPDAAGKRR